VRIQTFTAKTVAAAMADVRRALGRDAVIIQVEEATRKNPAKVVAAVEPTHVQARADSIIDSMPEITRTNWQHTLQPLFDWHGLTADLQTRVLATLESFDAIDAAAALTQALSLTFRFTPVAIENQSSIMLVGQPGHGKSLATARLAAAAKARGCGVRVITLDGGSAGAMAQLDAFCAPLEIAVDAISSDNLQLSDVRGDGITIVDTAGINPYDLADVASLSRVLARTGIEPVWIMTCGIDSRDACEQAQIFSALGVQRLIATHADSCRRFGTLFNVLDQQNMSLAGLCASPFVAEPMLAGSVALLAQKLLAVPRDARMNKHVPHRKIA
jgi:flagellar biosynthesis protein FlhF